MTLCLEATQTGRMSVKEATMFDRIIDQSNPRYRGSLPKPARTPTSTAWRIAEEVSREQAAEQPNYTDDYAKLTRDDWTLRYYYEGDTVACRSTSEAGRGAGRRMGRGRPVPSERRRPRNGRAS